MAGLPADRRWQRPYILASMALLIVGMVCFLSFLDEAYDVASPNRSVGLVLGYATLLGYGCVLIPLLLARARERKLETARPPGAAP